MDVQAPAITEFEVDIDLVHETIDGIEEYALECIVGVTLEVEFEFPDGILDVTHAHAVLGQDRRCGDEQHQGCQGKSFHRGRNRKWMDVLVLGF